MEAIVEVELQLDGAQVRAMLRNTGVLQWHGATKQGSLVVQDDLIGIKGGGELCIILHTFCISSSSSSSKRPICGGAAAAIPKRKRKDMRLSFANEASRQMWYETIQRFLDEAGRPKKLMVIVNPFGGEGAEKKLFLQIVEPLLLAAKISFTMKEMMFNSHAKELANSMDLSQFDGIVCVSGDEVLVEVLNGLLQRVDWKHAIRKPLGIIPAGTGNGMAKSLLHMLVNFLMLQVQHFSLSEGTSKYWTLPQWHKANSGFIAF
ncbi:hypothetical protein CY35_05G024900 [Sphagnum magellanicum]|nr:hypothetical protein CY35_05G024900 [Sphagnum magellanicum]